VKITDVKAVYLDIGTGPRPNSDGGYRNQKRSFGYVEVFTDEGLTGFCPAAATPSIVEGELKPVLVGENPLEIERIWTRLFQGWRHPKMDEVMTISKVDIAIWDLMGKILNQPVWRLLGGARNRVRAYGAGGMYQPGKDVGELVNEMTDFVGAGFQAVKMKVGGLSTREDVERVRAVREAIGPDIDLMVDANHAWLPYEAIQFGRMVEDLRPYWLEEPVNPWDHRGCAEVARALDMPVATGENVSTRYAFRDMIDARAADIIQADALYCGGITEWRKIAAYADAHNLPMAPHGNAHVGAAGVAGVPNGLIVEVGMYAGRKTVRPPIVQPLEVRDGYVTMSEEPGLNFLVDRDAIRWNLENPGV
jgi:L-alanine-DL-glutamate epimerase-like enolase superfamily enzyme